MTEYESEPEDEKLEFTPEGETLGYISLDQARVLALQHARDNREFYGRYAHRELVWEVIGVDETEDFYEVRLSYRPAGTFRGQPGVEQFTIDKTGPIEFRQVISRPVEKRRWVLLTGISVAVALVVAGAVVAAILAQGGKPSELTEAPTRAPAIIEQGVNSEELIETPVIEEAVSPQGENTGEFIGAPARGAWFYPITENTPMRWSPLSADVAIALDAGSVDRVVGLEFDLVSEIPSLPAGFVVSGTPFDLSVQPDHDSAAIPYTFLKPLTLTFRLSGTDVTLARGNESNVVIQRFKGDSWTRLTTAVDFGSSTAMVQVDSLSLFVLTIWEGAGSPVPAPTPTAAPTPTPLLTATPLPTATPTLIAKPLPTPTATPTPTPTPVPSNRIIVLSSNTGTTDIVLTVVGKGYSTGSATVYHDANGNGDYDSGFDIILATSDALISEGVFTASFIVSTSAFNVGGNIINAYDGTGRSATQGQTWSLLAATPTLVPVGTLAPTL